MNAASQILGHNSVVHSVHAHLFQSLAELDQVWVSVQITTVLETLGPRENAGDWVGTGWISLKYKKNSNDIEYIAANTEAFSF